MILKYRPEIDGLRAIAVTAVILYHAKFFLATIPLFKGGFMGVDIFFVISGYLITSIILRELKDKSFSFSSFYERRARRILPPLFIIMIISIPFAWAYMLPMEMKSYAGSILSTLAFSSNIWFCSEDSYAAAPSILKPFLHTWSLSVEEQFYWLFPIFLLIVWKFFRKYIASILMLGILFSLQLAELGSGYHTGYYKNAAFFLLPTRMWELLAGAILAKLELNKVRLNRPFLDSIMSSMGIFFIIYSIVFFNDQMQHPSFITLIPVIGTMLVIWFSKPGELMGDILGSKPFVGVGLISYSLYLWHTPIFAFAHIKYKTVSQVDKIWLLALSGLLAVLTYYFVEKPTRNRLLISRRNISIILGSIFTLLCGIQRYFYFSDGVQQRYPINLYYPYQKEFREGLCFLSPQNVEENIGFSQCQNTEVYSKEHPLIFLWGDSHAAHLYQGLKASIPSGFTILQRTASSCPPLIDRSRGARPEKCNKLNLKTLEEIKTKQPTFIILAAAWSSYEKEIDITNTLKAIKNITKAKIILVGPVPTWNPALPRKLIEEVGNNTTEIPSEIPYKLMEQDKIAEEKFKKIADLEKVDYFSMLNHICNNQSCKVLIGRDPISWDQAHLTTSGSKFTMHYLVDDMLKLTKEFPK